MCYDNAVPFNGHVTSITMAEIAGKQFTLATCIAYLLDGSQTTRKEWCKHI